MTTQAAEPRPTSFVPANSVSRDFLTGGHAIFTASSPKGTHYTFSVSRPKDFTPDSPVWFVSVLTGSDNTSDYTYLGLLDGSGLLRLTKKSREYYTEKTPSYEVGRWAIAKIWRGEEMPDGYKIQHMGKCGRCGRPLTDPLSCELGIGPICREKE